MQTTFTIQGIHCRACVMLLTMHIEELEGIQDVTIDEKTGITTINFDEKQINQEDITKVIVNTGDYTVHI